MKHVAGGNSGVTLKWKKDFLPEVCTSSVEVYDPAMNTWSQGPELANALCGAGKYILIFALCFHSVADSDVISECFLLQTTGQ